MAKKTLPNINGFTEKTTPVDADIAMIESNADSNAKRKLSWANIKATLKTYFDTLYSTAVKATGAELDTGTDDAKFATAKALADSKYVKQDEAVTLTNKRVTPRVSSEASSATPTINTDNVDAHSITALAADITSIANPI
jgi:hypothetical protein